MAKLLYIALGGAAGAGLRYVVSLAALRLGGAGFPWGTLVVNVVGSLFAGFIWGLLDETTGQQRTNAFFFIGLLGAVTTFSAYSLESMRLFNDDRTMMAVVNVLANNVGAILAVFAGFALARALFPATR